MIDQFALAICAKLRTDMNNYCDDLASGSAKSMEEYREICGRIRGLAIAEEYVKDLAKNVEDSEDG